MEAKLIVIGGKANKSEVVLKLPTTIGRSRSADLTVAHPKVSRQHCQIFERDGVLVVRDNESLNGTFIDNEKITEAILKPGDKLTVGPLTFVAVYEHAGSFPTLNATNQTVMQSTVPNKKVVSVDKSERTTHGARPKSGLDDVDFETPDINLRRQDLAPATATPEAVAPEAAAPPELPPVASPDEAAEVPDFAGVAEAEIAAEFELPAAPPPWQAEEAVVSDVDDSPASDAAAEEWTPDESHVHVAGSPAAPIDMTETLPDQVEHEAPQMPLGTAPAAEAGEDFSWLDKPAEPIEAIEAESPAVEELAMEVEEIAAEEVAESPPPVNHEATLAFEATVQFQAEAEEAFDAPEPITAEDDEEDIEPIAVPEDTGGQPDFSAWSPAAAESEPPAEQDETQFPTVDGRDAAEEESPLPTIQLGGAEQSAADAAPEVPFVAAHDSPATPVAKPTAGKGAKPKKGWWPFGGKKPDAKKHEAQKPDANRLAAATKHEIAAVEETVAQEKSPATPEPISIGLPEAAPVADDLPPFFAPPAEAEASAGTDDQLNEFFKNLK